VELTGTLNNLSTVCRETWRSAEAIAILEEVRRTIEDALGPTHHTVATILDNLAVVHCDPGNYQEAEALLERAILISETSLGPDNPITGDLYAAYASVLRKLKRVVEAKSFERRAKAVRVEHSSANPLSHTIDLGEFPMPRR
jgi:tetratricopeptide (TPR) repeat protein